MPCSPLAAKEQQQQLPWPTSRCCSRRLRRHTFLNGVTDIGAKVSITLLLLLLACLLFVASLFFARPYSHTHGTHTHIGTSTNTYLAAGSLALEVRAGESVRQRCTIKLRLQQQCVFVRLCVLFVLTALLALWQRRLFAACLFLFSLLFFALIFQVAAPTHAHFSLAPLPPTLRLLRCICKFIERDCNSCSVVPHATCHINNNNNKNNHNKPQRNDLAAKKTLKTEKPQTKGKGKGNGRHWQWVHWPSPSRTQHQQQRRRCPVSCLAGREGKAQGWGSGTATAGRSAVRLVCLFFASGFYPIFNALAFPIPAHTHTNTTHTHATLGLSATSLPQPLSLSLSFQTSLSTLLFQPPRSFRQLDQKGSAWFQLEFFFSTLIALCKLTDFYNTL